VGTEAWAQLASEERSEAFLVALRESLQRQSRVPPLPPGWRSESAMIPAEGLEYGGDFFVAHLADDVLQMVLVDACGHGPSAVPDAVEFAGALGALVLSVPPCELMAAANRYVFRRGRPDGFTTAVQVTIRLSTGELRIRSAGHPPVMRWCGAEEEWVVDNARGTALGVTEDPTMSDTSGILVPGDALMFYTDGVVEARGDDIDDGIARLRTIARDAVAEGFDGAPARILAGLPRGEDDRAVLIMRREPAPNGVPVPRRPS
jgi:serine phosphatase RsbU (regulator of sigma subunit)